MYIDIYIYTHVYLCMYHIYIILLIPYAALYCDHVCVITCVSYLITCVSKLIHDICGRWREFVSPVVACKEIQMRDTTHSYV